MSNEKNKVMSLHDAIAKYVHDGDHIVLGGFVTHRRPVAAAYEIIRQGIKDLVYESAGGAMDGDLLIGAGAVKILLESYMANSGYTQVCRRMRSAIEKGELMFEDYSLDVQPIQYHAAALGSPYIPIKNMLGSDLEDKWGIPAEEWKKNPKLPNAKFLVEDNPFNPGVGDRLLLLPAAPLDCAIIHAQYAAPDGTCRIEGLGAIDADIAMGATNCIVMCEQIVSPDFLRAEPWANTLPGLVADAVCEVPYGCHPLQCANFYDYDGMFMRMYDEVSKTPEQFKEFLDEYVYGVKDHMEYLDKLGAARLLTLRTKAGWGYVPGLKRK